MRTLTTILTVVGLVLALSCSTASPPAAAPIFDTPEQAVRSLVDTVKTGKLDAVVAIFGPEGRDLITATSHAEAARRLEVFAAAAAERWHLQERGQDSQTLVIGSEDWPFPVPLVKDAKGWRFDTAAGKEEVLARQIGRNELSSIRVCRTYVAAQRLYSARAHDNQPAGIYAMAFRSEPGRENGLHWPATKGGRRSPLGDLVADAALDRRAAEQSSGPQPFHGYHFKILTEQGPAATGGAQNYVRNGAMSGGFALVAWPAQYDVTGVMTFIVNHDGIVHQRDLGPDTDAVARAMSAYQPDSTWEAIR